MGWKDADPYQYHYDRGLYYHEISPDLLCGSQPRNVADVAELREEVGVTTVINVGMHGYCKLQCHCTLLSATQSKYVLSLSVETDHVSVRCSCSKMQISSTGM